VSQPEPNGTACNDQNACTQSDTCQNGICSGSNPVQCMATDKCHVAGTCDPSTGMCSNPPKMCTASDQCHVPGTCDSTTGVCSNPPAPNGTVCDDGNPCTQTDTCQNGLCVGTNPVICTAKDQCHVAGTCDPTTGCSNPSKADGTPCDDGNACTFGDSCQAGSCVGTSVTCTSDQCNVRSCNGSSTCTVTALSGTPCDDGNACTTGDSCQAGLCVGGPAVSCTSLDSCHLGGVCDPARGCSNPEITCVDHDSCYTWAECALNCPTSGGQVAVAAPGTFAAECETVLCRGETIPTKITNVAGKGKGLIDRAKAVGKPTTSKQTRMVTRKIKKVLGKAAGDFDQAVGDAKMAAKSKKASKRISSNCAALEGVYGEAASRVQQLRSNPLAIP
jgi:hypothetical protein